MECQPPIPSGPGALQDPRHPWASRLAGEQEIRRRLCKAFHRRGLSPEASARLASALLYLAASAEG